MILDVEYTDYHPTALYHPNWCKGILVFNTTYGNDIYCHRISYGAQRRKDAIGVFHITYK